MGMIQSALNQLSLSAIGSVAAGAKAIKGLPKATEQADNSYAPGHSYLAAAHAFISGNDMIEQKARASFKGLKERISKISQGGEE